MPDDLPVFPRIAVIGLGLIGGSIALAARQHWHDLHLIGLDETPVLDQALSRRMIDAPAHDLGDVSGADLIVLAAPVQQNVELLRKLATAASAPAIITDVGGTKRVIVEAAETLPPHLTFIGGHPLGGAEHSGIAFARANLFEGRPWIFTPRDGHPTEAVERLSRFVSVFGAVPTTMTASEHDRVMAFLSHLPQLTASALMETVGRAVESSGLALAGGGLADTTRLASSPATVWRDICATNADAVANALDLLIDRLVELRNSLQYADTIDKLFDEASRWRGELMRNRQ